MIERKSDSASDLRVSVIVPYHSTHKHCLKDCIEALSAQTIPRSDYEVLLVNAEDDQTIEPTVKKIADTHQDFNFHYYCISKGGRAAARNHGVRQAQAEVVIHFSTDFIATPELLEHHLELHEQSRDEKIVGIGSAVFAPKLIVTPFMRWLEESGSLYAG